MTNASAARRIDHVAVAVRDATLSARWYEDTLGMTIVGDEIIESKGVRLVYLATEAGKDAAVVQLAEPIGAGAIRNFVDAVGEGLHHVCFAVDQLKAVLDERTQSYDAIFMGGRGRQACFLDDQPASVLIELTEA